MVYYTMFTGKISFKRLVPELSCSTSALFDNRVLFLKLSESSILESKFAF